MRRYPILAAMVLALAGCAVQQTAVETPAFDQQLKNPPLNYSSGSIWQASSGGLLEDGKARHVGDVVTIIITETASASKQAATATGRTSSMSAGIPAFMGLQGAGILANNLGGDLSNLISASASSKFDGSGSTSRKESLNATISAKVTDVLPNGNLRIEGHRHVKVNSEDQIVTVRGTIRPRDISVDNTINSSYIADAQISYSGSGVISDRQHPGWLMNIVDKLWPF